MAYLDTIASQLGVEVWILTIILIWSAAWKLIGMWKAARKNSPIWFVVLFFINTVGILEILYVYVFSEIDWSKAMKEKPKSSKKTKKKTKKRKTEKTKK